MTNILANFTDHKKSKISAAFQLIGTPESKPHIHTGNRNTVRGFLNGLGFSTEVYIDLDLDTLSALYRSPAEQMLAFVPLIMSMKPNASAAEVAATLADILSRIQQASARAYGMPNAKDVVDAVQKNAQGSEAKSEQPAEQMPEIDNDANPAESDKAKDGDKVKVEMTPELAEAMKMMLEAMQGKPQPKPEGGNGLHHEKLPIVIQMLNAGLNVFMCGGAGSGKTTIAEQAAKALNLPFYFNGALDSEYKLTGFIDAQGRVVSTAFRKAYSEGGVYLFDEVDASLPSALLAFNAALANGHSDFPDGCIKKHDNFRCVAAANTFGRGADRLYVGRNQLDAATMDRFCVINIDYDEKLERAIATNATWVRVVQKIRAAVYKLKIRHIVSPRASIYGSKLLETGMKQADVMDCVVWKGLDKDQLEFPTICHKRRISYCL